ncbi:MAG: hypothetical protein CVV64_02230 [Candidatus Wallbacteria bacterium HGW-Wallbacteria-1]|uniref:Uncharacterized protein n=1 Tax=Candidatus Wallbacteria bacterium HGW-Wallbacteria-1 TaxID=2013854 RepID=A0A2N1PVD1_9BACT|nr:MAG: hypothetical protein CVV64_02230 [Candidatus Wallbacteria bacterium HGW-Wallbacteria-1]
MNQNTENKNNSRIEAQNTAFPAMYTLGACLVPSMVAAGTLRYLNASSMASFSMFTAVFIISYLMNRLCIPLRATNCPADNDDDRTIKSLRTELEKTRQTLESKSHQLENARELTKAVTCVLNLETLLSMILDKGLELAAAKTGSIMLLDYDTNYLTVKVARGMARDIQKKVRVKIGEGIAGHVFKTGNPLLIRDIENAGEFSKKSSSKYETHSLISVPLKIKERCIGVFNINNKQDGTSFNDDDLATIALLAAYASISIDTARLYDNLSKSIISIVKLATNALEAKDSYTAGHSERVTEFGTEIAKAMGLEEERIEIIRQAGLLHDIGKIGINDAVLLKPSRLTEEEFEIIKTHPAIGYAIVAPMEISLEVREAILHHHERYDGRGYPDGQKNDEISLEARVLCVADSFDAMTSTRAYRKSLPNHIVAKELIKCSGSQFDPEVVQVFLDILKERQFYTDEDMDAINEELEKDKAKGGRY